MLKVTGGVRSKMDKSENTQPAKRPSLIETDRKYPNRK
jgi:hypothetical protein